MAARAVRHPAPGPAPRHPVAPAPAALAPVAPPPAPPAPVPTPAPAAPATHHVAIGAIVILLLVLLAAVICASVFSNKSGAKPDGKTAMEEKIKAKKAEVTKADAEAVEADDMASNLEALRHEEAEHVALILLTPREQIAIRKLIETGFASFDKATIERTAEDIYNIGGQEARKIVSEYINSGKAIIRVNAVNWYRRYCPKEFNERLKRLERSTPPMPTATAPTAVAPVSVVPPAPPAPAPVAPPPAQTARHEHGGPTATATANVTVNGRRVTSVRQSSDDSGDKAADLQKQVRELRRKVISAETDVASAKEAARQDSSVERRNIIRRAEIQLKEARLDDLRDELKDLEIRMKGACRESLIEP